MKITFAGALLSLFALASAVAGKPEVVERTGDLHFTCPKSCKFPAHSEPHCSLIKPCGFDCTNGYLPHPPLFPTKCVCTWPFTECNGKCGIFKACPSKGHHKRDLPAANAQCPVGHSACGIVGRATGSWECIDTQRDLESCGGCLLSTTGDFDEQDGQDCTAIEGVSDVSCVRGFCMVKKCMHGYEVDESNSSCQPIERTKNKSLFSVAKDVLAVEYGA
ncbi:hypothetical protein DFP72DRAFT_893569 [Ephemerocybe angulata]|uniref:Protein CPL1-like domain-containing protein n=1 Tax=Ephemerocybe angulata TaxID=980116 RepID=A0A8H6I2I6_9AGAR|nr:hypothetical protein DFP72DRAFT_893569 [Tulosesus angulatus]